MEKFVVAIFFVCCFLCLVHTLTNLQYRIVGGQDTHINKYPFLVQLWADYTIQAGGTLITHNFVLTAAHCFDELGPSDYKIRLGTSFAEPNAKYSKIYKLKIHENYNKLTLDSDIALITLEFPVITSASVAIATIIKQGVDIPDNALVTYVGWGKSSFEDQYSAVLQEVDVPTVNHEECRKRYESYPIQVTENMICTGLLDVGGKDACVGDSGGPLIHEGEVVGITSWGEGCGTAKYPGVSVKLANFVDWINAEVTDFENNVVHKEL